MKKTIFYSILFAIAAIFTWILYTFIGKFITDNNNILYRIILIIVYVQWFIVFLRNDLSVNKFPWLVVLAVFPIPGIILFYLTSTSFQNSKRFRKKKYLSNKEFLRHETNNDFSPKKRSKIDSKYHPLLLSTTSKTKRSIYFDTNNIEILTNGDSFFPKLNEQLEKATISISMQFPILKTDKIGKKVLGILKRKADQGLEIRIIYDPVMTMNRANCKYLKTLKHSGVKIAKFDPLFSGIINNSLNYRNHRKITIIDNKIAFIGGSNLGDEYNSDSKKFGFWRDTNLLICGSAVKSLNIIFQQDWYYITKEIIDIKECIIFDNPNSGFTQIIEFGPNYNEKLIKNTYFTMITTATKNIKIMTPYLILQQDLLTALIEASNKGVDISIIVPGKPDKYLVNMATKSYYEMLLKHNINIYEYKNVFTHGKIILIDDELASVGSANFDIRSFNLNFEVVALFNQDNAIKHLINDFKKDICNSNKIEWETWKNRSITSKLIQSFCNLFSPLL